MEDFSFFALPSWEFIKRCFTEFLPDPSSVSECAILLIQIFLFFSLVIAWFLAILAAMAFAFWLIWVLFSGVFD